MNQTIFILIAAFVISTSGLVVNFIKRGDAEGVENDGGTLFWFRVLVPLGLAFSLLFYFLKIKETNHLESVVNLGYFLVIFGLLLRWFSIWQLGRAFTVSVKIIDNHQLNTAGIYQYIRHPSYTGLLLYYLGLGLVMENWVSLALLIFAPFFAVLYRLRQEEAVLIGHFGAAYLAYQKRSWRLFPFIF